MVKIIPAILFAVENNSLVLNKINPQIEKFINHAYKNTSLKYDIQNKTGKAVMNEIKSINEFRQKLINEISEESDKREDIIAGKIMELLNSEIELECRPVKLSLLLEEECSGFDFGLLDGFILDDRNTVGKSDIRSDEQ